jgi:hypothetical protein
MRSIPLAEGRHGAIRRSRNEDFTYGQDDTGKYLYLIYENSNQTVLLDKRTGAVAGTLDIALPTRYGSQIIWPSESRTAVSMPLI